MTGDGQFFSGGENRPSQRFAPVLASRSHSGWIRNVLLRQAFKFFSSTQLFHETTMLRYMMKAKLLKGDIRREGDDDRSDHVPRGETKETIWVL